MRCEALKGRVKLKNGRNRRGGKKDGMKKGKEGRTKRVEKDRTKRDKLYNEGKEEGEGKGEQNIERRKGMKKGRKGTRIIQIRGRSRERRE